MHTCMYDLDTHLHHMMTGRYIPDVSKRSCEKHSCPGECPQASLVISNRLASSASLNTRFNAAAINGLCWRALSKGQRDNSV